MIKSEIIIKKLDKMLSKELGDIVIYINENGYYDLYNHYNIVKENNKSYTVKCKTSFTTKSFYSLKNAVAWVINDKRNRILEAKRIFELDSKLESLNNSIELHKTLLNKKTEDENKLIYFSKLSDEKVKKQQILKELNSYIMESNDWQQKQFLNQFQ